MREIRLNRILATKFTRENFNMILKNDYKIIDHNPCKDIVFAINEEYAGKEDFNEVLNLIKDYCYHSLALDKNEAKGLSRVFVYSPFIVDVDVIEGIHEHYMDEMERILYINSLLDDKTFKDLEYYRRRVLQIRKILDNEYIEESTFYIEILNF